MVLTFGFEIFISIVFKKILKQFDGENCYVDLMAHQMVHQMINNFFNNWFHITVIDDFLSHFILMSWILFDCSYLMVSI